MKYVVLVSPYLDSAHAVGVAFTRGKPEPVTDEQAEVLLKNPSFEEAPDQTPARASIAPTQVPSTDHAAPEDQGERE